MNKFLLLLFVLFVVSCSKSKETETVEYTLTTLVNCPGDPGDCVINPVTSKYKEGTNVLIHAFTGNNSTIQYVFTGWTLDENFTENTAEPTRNLIMNRDYSIRANFKIAD